jgi:NAD(P)-dependent dehydrogenase (short-subunit alcohol dehydrogenase family)
LIYGGGTGLGYSCAECMAREGAIVFVAGRREDRLRQAVAKLSEIGRAGYAAGDATTEADVRRITGDAVAFMGGLDTLVNSAGTSGVGSILEETLIGFKQVADANLLSTFLSSRHAAPYMVDNGSGSIIAISSMYGLVGQYQRVAYCASKAGVIGMIRAIGLDLATTAFGLTLSVQVSSRRSWPGKSLAANRIRRRPSRIGDRCIRFPVADGLKK